VRKELCVDKKNRGLRLDKFVALNSSNLSRTRIGKMIERGEILVNGEKKKSSYTVKEKDKVVVSLLYEEIKILKPYPVTVDILYEDNDIIVVNKPKDLVVHPPKEGCQRTLVNALIYMGKKLSSVNPARPAIVHRLDKETTGVMVLAKNNYSHLKLIKEFRERKVKKEYRAMVWGVFKEDDVSVELPLKRHERNRLKMKVSMFKSKQAITHIKVLKRLSDSTYVQLLISTGRTHQIRVHMNFLGYPIVGDKKYGRKDNFGTLFLHSFRLGFRHPSNREFMEFEAPLPDWFNRFMEENS